MLESVLGKIQEGAILSKQDAITLLGVKNTSEDFYRILSFANERSKKMLLDAEYEL